jgi:hypothetical protein
LIRGQGLGKKEDGMVAHLRIDKKKDAGGVGIEAVALAERDQTNVWWHDAFAGTLKNIDVGGKSKKKAKKDKEKKSSKALDDGVAPPSFEELFKATGGARLGMRARRKQTGKLERADHVKLQVGADADSGSQTPSADDTDLAMKAKRKEERRKLKRERFEANEAEARALKEKRKAEEQKETDADSPRHKKKKKGKSEDKARED